MIPRIDYKIQILNENYNEYCRNSEDGEGDGMSLREYVERESESDPAFFRWLFDDGYINDFGTNLSEERFDEYRSLLEEL